MWGMVSQGEYQRVFITYGLLIYQTRQLTKPFNNSVRSKGKGRSMMLSPSMTSEQLCTRSEPFFGTCFRENAWDIDTCRLSKICKLVCRDWARRFPIHRPGQDTSQIRKAIMQYWMDEQWCFLPDKYWRWMFKDVMWSERCCEDFPRCVQTGCRNKGWRLKVRSINAALSQG